MGGGRRRRRAVTSADRAVRPSRALAPPRPVLLLLLLLLPVRCNAGKPGCHTRLLASTAGAKTATRLAWRVVAYASSWPRLKPWPARCPGGRGALVPIPPPRDSGLAIAGSSTAVARLPRRAGSLGTHCEGAGARTRAGGTGRMTALAGAETRRFSRPCGPGRSARHGQCIRERSSAAKAAPCCAASAAADGPPARTRRLATPSQPQWRPPSPAACLWPTSSAA